MKDNRIAELDFFKGIAIILVVCGHIIQFNWTNAIDSHPVYMWIYSFHMPLFIFISGFLINHTNQKRTILIGPFIIRKIKVLVIPYIVWTFIIWPMLDGGAWGATLMQFVNPNARYWFVYVLFWLCVIYVFCEWGYRKKPLWGGVLLLLITSSLIISQSIYPIGLFNSVIQYIPIFFYGVVASKFSLTGNRILTHPITAALFFVVFVISSNQYMKFDLSYINKLMKLLSSFSLCSIVLLFIKEQIISSIDNNVVINAIKYIGKNSIVIYLTHFGFLTVFMSSLEAMNCLTPFWSFVLSLALSSVIILACLIIGLTIERFKWINRLLYGRW